MIIYLDTTVPSFAVSFKDTPEIKVSKKLFTIIKREEFIPYVSWNLRHMVNIFVKRTLGNYPARRGRVSKS